MNRITWLNRALMRIGADPLVSEAEPGADVHLAVFDSVYDHVSGCYPWSFLNGTARLPRLVSAPALWLYAYQMPTDALGPIRAVYTDPQGRNPTGDYTIMGAELHTDHDQITVRYTRAMPVEHWPPGVREAFTVLLMAELALSVREDQALRNRLRIEALGNPATMSDAGMLGAAFAADSQSEPGLPPGGPSPSHPFIDARR